MTESRWQFWIDVGGTFTDCLANAPGSTALARHKLLSSATYKVRVARTSASKSWHVELPDGTPEAFFTGFSARVADVTTEVLRCDVAKGTLHLDAEAPATAGALCELISPEPAPVCGIRWLLGTTLNATLPAADVRLGTTKGTNALLERKGARTALVTTRGFADVVEIGYQNRPRLFSLDIKKPRPLYEAVIEADERLGAKGEVLRTLDEAALTRDFAGLRARGIDAVAICFLHSYRNDAHEQRAGLLARAAGFVQISLSSQVASAQRIVPRCETTLVDAYLTPVIRDYLQSIRAALPNASLKLMTSAGGLTDAAAFVGKDSILSGPAGGVVGVARVAREASESKVIGFDMGGTSTDVSRFDGELERRFEMELTDPESDAGVRIVAPMLAIETVAAGGGSLCAFDGTRLVVGPQSAGADPGPAAYGGGGPLTITDCNLALGRLLPERFGFPLDPDASRRRLTEVREALRTATGRDTPEEVLAEGFLAIAASNMAAPIKKISLSRGYDAREYALVSFGGAGAQHACDVADDLGMTRILQHPLASLLSAYGIGAADVRRFKAKDLGMPLPDRGAPEVDAAFAALAEALRTELKGEGVRAEELSAPTCFLDVRYRGQDALITVQAPEDGDWRRAFEKEHATLYGFAFPARTLEARSARVELVARTPYEPKETLQGMTHAATHLRTQRAWMSGAWRDVPVYALEALRTAATVAGPALVAAEGTVIVIGLGWRGEQDGRGGLTLSAEAREGRTSTRRRDSKALTEPVTEPDPITLSLYVNHVTQIAEQMGTALQRTSLSVNVKERLDFSCAVFGPDGGLVVNAPHIPVHLGSMSDTVRAVWKERGREMRPGDVFVTNDPYRGGSHLPDVTVITPVFAEDGRTLLFFTGNRAHHAEIGGTSPGSMPPFSKTLAEEGALIRCFRLVSGARASEDELQALLMAGPFPTRSVEDNLADVRAQAAANELGRRKLLELVATRGLADVQAYLKHIRNAAERRMRQALLDVSAGEYRFADAMDDGTPVVCRITIAHGNGTADTNGAHAIIDFAGTGGVSLGNLNANAAIVKAAVLYAFRCLIGRDVPLNEGVLAPLDVRIPSPSLLAPPEGDDPAQLAAVVAGNVETSQRLCDVLIGALGLAAASQGTMNNVLFGRKAENGRAGFGYYETVCGGAGAGPEFAGASAVHTHMTNTRITDPEVLEERFPVRLHRFGVRRGSGGAGACRGGDGAVRELEFLEALDLSLLTSRRASAPFGLAGGEAGLPGKNTLVRADGSREVLAGMAQTKVSKGDRLILETPGGGGYGLPERA